MNESQAGGQGKRGEGERGKHKYVQRELHVYNDATFVCVYSGWATRHLSGVHKNTPTFTEKY